MGDKDPGKTAVRDAINATKVRNCNGNVVFCVSSEGADSGESLSYSSD